MKPGPYRFERQEALARCRSLLDEGSIDGRDWLGQAERRSAHAAVNRAYAGIRFNIAISFLFEDGHCGPPLSRRVVFRRSQTSYWECCESILRPQVGDS